MIYGETEEETGLEGGVVPGFCIGEVLVRLECVGWWRGWVQFKVVVSAVRWKSGISTTTVDARIAPLLRVQYGGSMTLKRKVFSKMTSSCMRLAKRKFV